MAGDAGPRIVLPTRTTAPRRVGGGSRPALLELARLAGEVAESLSDTIDEAGALVAGAVLAGGKVLACGNGGSAADAQHFVAELVGHMSRERRPLPAIALSSDPSILTAIGNDYGYDRLFSRQVDAHGMEGDVLVAITTSGRSPNVLRALATARELGMGTVLLTGSGGTGARGACDVLVAIPSSDTQHVQELHTAVLHAICARVDDAVIDAPRHGVTSRTS